MPKYILTEERTCECQARNRGEALAILKERLAASSINSKVERFMVVTERKRKGKLVGYSYREIKMVGNKSLQTLRKGALVCGCYKDQDNEPIRYTGVVYSVKGGRATIKRDDREIGGGAYIPGYGRGWIVTRRGRVWYSNDDLGEPLIIC